ncbi:MAG: VanZ family protein [Ardenticatenaceae bacterium]|nr:VanZ family protein [Ardenticatenaceae bacterium]
MIAGPYSDIPLNIVLFIPFGFGLVATLVRRNAKTNRCWFFFVLLAGFSLTFFVEFLQLFLSDRTSTLSDMLSNTLGAVAGYIVFWLWQNRIRLLVGIKPLVFNTQVISVSFLFYLIILMLSAYWIKEGFQLKGWQPNYHLILGNEKTQDRPWAGKLNHLVIFDRALSENEVSNLFVHGNFAPPIDSLVAFYPLTNQAMLFDRTGNLPNLHWVATEQNQTIKSPYQLNGTHWLETELPVTFLNQALLNSSEFTISLVVKVSSVSQYGPARILSIGADPFQQNLMIGQEGTDLIVRVRTPFTGNNGTVPEWKIANVFVNEATNHLVITYDGISIKVFVNDNQAPSKIEFIPGAVFYVLLFSPNVVHIDPLTAEFLSILFYFFTLMPASIFIMLFVSKTSFRSQKLLLFIGGSIIPTLGLELIFSADNNFDLRLSNLLTSIFIILLLSWCLTTINRSTMLFNRILA